MTTGATLYFLSPLVSQMNSRTTFLVLLFLATNFFIGNKAIADGKRYALVVGVSTYRPGQPLPELEFTENDATELAKVLGDGGYKVTLMTQTVGRDKGSEVLSPMSDYIRDQLLAILDNPFLKPEDVVIVAFAGHGVQYELVEGGKKTPKFYFCPSDADVAKLRTANDVTDRSRLIDLSEVYQSLSDCKAGGKLLLVDACRNDPSKPSVSRSLTSVTLPPLPPPPGGTAAYFSCSAHQQAFEDKDLKHGVFFHHVIEALKGDADAGTSKRPADGQITLTELSDHVSMTTYDYVRDKFKGARQAPELKGEFRLSIPLLKLRNQPKEVPGNAVDNLQSILSAKTDDSKTTDQGSSESEEADKSSEKFAADFDVQVKKLEVLRKREVALKDKLAQLNQQNAPLTEKLKVQSELEDLRKMIKATSSLIDSFFEGK